jgi:hypothetical protein
VQGGEFIVATDTGFGLANNANLSVCALTNLSNIATVTPTLTCAHTSISHYDDPFPARQPGGPIIPVAFGPKQMYYKAGHLFFAWTIGAFGRDIINWEEIRPELTLSRIDVITDAVRFDDDTSDLYAPAIVGTDEDDIVLIYNRSNLVSLSPSLRYVGRKAADLHGYFESLYDATVINGAHATTASWAKYSACAISLNSVTRGTIWCAGEYPGSIADPGWNTRIFNLRAE